MRIYRVFNTGFGKRAKWRRAADFASFLVSCSSRLCRLPKQDLVVALTSPPLVSALGAWFARVRGGSFCYWVMDLNPDEAIAAGWLAPRSLAARSLERISRYSLRRASTVVVLDRFMQKKILDKGIDGSKVGIFPPWSHDSEVRFDLAGRNLFRATHGLENKFVVMYSVNHSPCHPLDSILSAARALGRQQDVAFCFVGGGSEFVRVKRFSADHHLANITCLPYQPLDQLAGTLSAADLHLVVMGDPFVGLVHPCKIYNILRVGLPLLYVGPSPSHVTEMLAEVKNSFACRFARHGEIDPIIQHILELKKNGVQPNGGEFTPLTERFSMQVPPSANDRAPGGVRTGAQPGASATTHYLMFDNWKIYLLAFLTGLFVTYLLTPVVRSCASRLGNRGSAQRAPAPQVAHSPRRRSGGGRRCTWRLPPGHGVHEASQPRSLITLVFLFRHRLTDPDGRGAGGCMSRGLRPLTKLAGQILAASLMCLSGTRFGRLFGIELPPALDASLAVFWIVAVINAFNLIDGLDGLASGLAIISSIGLCGCS